jgi:cobalt-zinc-cadmium resistance protein CzcA
MRNTLSSFLLAFISPWCLAQTPISLEEAVQQALKTNPSVKSGEFNYAAQKALKKTSFDWGKTSLLWMHGQYNSLNQDDNYTLTQSIPFPTVSVVEAQLNKYLAASAEQRLFITQTDLAYQVKVSYSQLQYFLAVDKLLKSQDTLYGNFARAATVRFKTGDGNLLEKTTAETQWMETRNLLQVNERDAAIERTRLQTLLHTDQELGPSEALAPRTFDPDELNASGLSANPQLNYWKYQVNATTAAKRIEQNKFLPDITVGYYNQSLTGFQRIGSTEIFYDKTKRFTGWQLGVSIPLWFAPQAGRSQAAALRQAASQQEYEGFQRQLNGQFEQATRELEKNQNNLQYYERDANPNAQLILKQSQRAYQGGEIGYVEYLHSLRQAYSIQAAYLAAIHHYNLAVLHLEYLLGKK